MRKNTLDNVMLGIEKITESGCWVHQNALHRDGYASIQYHGKKILLHRFIYERLVGPIPHGMELDHLCRVRCCSNPLHMELVTPRVNNLRSLSPSANNARKTACGKCGKPYDLIMGSRRCISCLRDYWRGRNALNRIAQHRK